eukprot:m.430499 g.430499  ORF g.430499 m.430499 type:complete len:62 (+) comp21395_c0_seq2:3074-3259(+)
MQVRNVLQPRQVTMVTTHLQDYLHFQQAAGLSQTTAASVARVVDDLKALFAVAEQEAQAQQ